MGRLRASRFIRYRACGRVVGGFRRESRPIRVAVAGLSLRYPNTGTARYAREVLAALAERSDPRSTIVVSKDVSPGSVQKGTLRVVQAPSLPLSVGNYGEKLYWEQIGFRWAALRTGADVWYSPHFAMPLFPGRPTILSVHDVIPYSMPEYAGNRAARAYLLLTAQAAKQATALVTLSRHAKAEIQRLLGIEEGRISRRAARGRRRLFHDAPIRRRVSGRVSANGLSGRDPLLRGRGRCAEKYRRATHSDCPGIPPDSGRPKVVVAAG